MRKLGVTLLSLAVGWVVMSCHANPSIDGTKVPTVGDPNNIPTCAQVCARMEALCGYAPTYGDCTTEAGDGYCDTQLSDDTKLCIGDGVDDGDGGTILTQSCQVAADCLANNVAPTPPDPDASDETTPADDSGATE